jgi:hypothetical protein
VPSDARRMRWADCSEHYVDGIRSPRHPLIRHRASVRRPMPPSPQGEGLDATKSLPLEGKVPSDARRMRWADCSERFVNGVRSPTHPLIRHRASVRRPMPPSPQGEGLAAAKSLPLEGKVPSKARRMRWADCSDRFVNGIRSPRHPLIRHRASVRRPMPPSPQGEGLAAAKSLPLEGKVPSDARRMRWADCSGRFVNGVRSPTHPLIRHRASVRRPMPPSPQGEGLDAAKTTRRDGTLPSGLPQANNRPPGDPIAFTMEYG